VLMFVHAVVDEVPIELIEQGIEADDLERG
jgi:hypothetical protein